METETRRDRQGDRVVGFYHPVSRMKKSLERGKEGETDRQTDRQTDRDRDRQ